MKTDILEKVRTFQGVFKEAPKRVPTNGEPDGPLCGNGDIGVTASCTQEIGSLDFYLSKNDLWYTICQEERPGMRGFGVLSFSSDRLAGGRFTATQTICDATVHTQLEAETHSLSVECRVLRKTNLIVHRVTVAGGALPLWIRFTPTTRENEEVELSQKSQGNRMTVSKRYTDRRLEWPLKAAAIVTIFGKDSLAFELSPGETVTVVTPFYTNQDSECYMALCENDSADITPEKLIQLERAHQAWWDDFWMQSAVFIPSEPEIERHWFGSHYLMACCCEKGKFPPGIFGNWITSDTPNWGADYHLNYNYQAPWWGAFSSNKIALTEPYDQPLLDYLPLAKKAAREKLGCRGAYMVVGIGPKGLKTATLTDANGNDDVNYWGQKSNSAYASMNMLMRFYHTYDMDYAKEIAWPFLIEVADFWEDYLKLEGDRYVIYNDCIHENGAAGKGVFTWVSDDTPDYSDDFNPILTLGLLRTLFKGLLDISEVLGVAAERRDKWQDILKRLSDFPLQQRNGKTVFRYTERGMDWCDSNSLGIQHIFPAGAIGLASPPALLQIARDTFEEMARWEDYNAFPTFFTAGARIGYDPDAILEKMDAEIGKHGFPNFFIYYGGGGIECCSAISSCINEMLLQSHEGVLRFFPVWNKKKDASFYQLRTYGAFVVSASLQNGVVSEIQLLSEKGRRCTLESPWPEGLSVLCEGASVEVSICNGVYTFETISGKSYCVGRA